MEKKSAWPPQIGSAKNVAIIDPKGDPDKDFQDHSHLHPDTFVPEKSVLEDQETITEIDGGGIISPVDGADWEKDLVDDQMQSQATIRISNNDNIVAEFSCGIAKTFQDKVVGLQAYSSLNPDAGLLFTYHRPEDVIYHMGTVKYPIDIIFVDSDHKIKKIYKNIQPGSLGVFGCAEVKNVLEICGGLSDRLGISKGDDIKIVESPNKHLVNINRFASELGIQKSAILKYSKLSRANLKNWKDFPILTINNTIVKEASHDHTISKLVSEFVREEPGEIYAFDFDGLIEEAPTVRVYKTSEVVEDGVAYIKLSGDLASIKTSEDGNELYRDVHIYELANLDSDESIILSLNKSFSKFLRTPKIIDDAIKLFSEVKKACKKQNSRVVFVTRASEPDYIREIVCQRILLEYGDRVGLEKVESLKIVDSADHYGIIDALQIKYGNRNIKVFSDDSILKRAGYPISDEIKEQAKRAYKYLESAANELDNSVSNMQHNLSEYESIKDNHNAIAKSKGQYNQSVKSQSRVVKTYLLRIREAVRILNEIKDISTTFGIIDSLASSSKITSDSIEDIFKLIDELDNPDFYMILSEKIDQYVKRVEDLVATIERAKEYINKEILGLVVLSS